MMLKFVDWLWRIILPNDTGTCQICGETFHRSYLWETEQDFDGSHSEFVACEECHLESLEMWVQKIREALQDKDSIYYRAYQEILDND